MDSFIEYRQKVNVSLNQELIPKGNNRISIQRDDPLSKRKMAKSGNKIHISLREKNALAALLQVKPTADMPKRAKQTIKRHTEKKPQK